MCSGCPGSGTVVTVPEAPSGLVASATSSSTVLISWNDNSDDETGFELDRSPDGSTSWVLIAAPASNAASFQDTGRSASTSFYYRIRAVNSAGASAYSGVATATTAALNVITGGPGASGAPGLTAFRITWLDNGGKADASCTVMGLPDDEGFLAAAHGYSVGFTPAFIDQYLGEGGLELNSSDFIDITFSTSGISSISHATLSIFGRSYSTVSKAGFTWQTFDDTGTTPADFVSNGVPYAWYSADVLSGVTPGETNGLLRITASGGSGALVVSQIELCLDAE